MGWAPPTSEGGGFTSTPPPPNRPPSPGRASPASRHKRCPGRHVHHWPIRSPPLRGMGDTLTTEQGLSGFRMDLIEIQLSSPSSKGVRACDTGCRNRAGSGPHSNPSVSLGEDGLHTLTQPRHHSNRRQRDAPTEGRSREPSSLVIILSWPRMPRLGSSCVPSVGAAPRGPDPQRAAAKSHSIGTGGVPVCVVAGPQPPGDAQRRLPQEWTMNPTATTSGHC